VSGLRSTGFPKPREGFAYGIHRRPDHVTLRLNEINVFGISKRISEQELVNGRAAAKSDLSFQPLAGEEVA